MQNYSRVTEDDEEEKKIIKKLEKGNKVFGIEIYEQGKDEDFIVLSHDEDLSLDQGLHYIKKCHEILDKLKKALVENEKDEY